jgi:hypothetical protein
VTFGDDRRGSNRRGGGRRADTALRHRNLGHAERVDEHDVRQGRQREDRALHRAQRRLVNVDAIDFR